MIRALRQRHRTTTTALSIILPVVFLIAVTRRNPLPLSAARPGLITSTQPTFNNPIWEKNDLWAKPLIKTRLFSNNPTNQPSRFAVQLIPEQPIIRPDVLAYWTPTMVGSLDQVPDSAVLLGSITGEPVMMPLPSSSGKTLGSLILYSLADHEVIGVSSPLPAPQP